MLCDRPIKISPTNKHSIIIEIKKNIYYLFIMVNILKVQTLVTGQKSPNSKSGLNSTQVGVESARFHCIVNGESL